MPRSEAQRICNQLDRIMSFLIRERADWTCEACYINWECDTRQLHWSHHITRKYHSIRWDTRNAAAHCAKCHAKFTEQPVLHGEWVNSSIYNDSYTCLQKKMKSTKYSLADKQDMYEFYKAEKKYLLAQRKDGVTGYLEFKNYEI